MEELNLSNEEAYSLIKILKVFLKKYNIDLRPGNKGILNLQSSNGEWEFLLDYFTPSHRDDKISIHLREKENNLSLLRVNIDPVGFHNNANNKICGNRMLIFSSDEWLEKNDGSTYVKAFTLPSEFSNPDNIEQVFLDFLLYINVKKENKINFPSLF
ncbi:hypothetical protein PY093_16420 [Cytobacillus sp. S13-E01]|uniref:DUF6978 family protein n=1 Tax=Cytobacillus sp. S13-E01 TaxID=3031326 RepID=UPI0023D88AD0|nr:hypothetical protein [Cytobacillus sp. S13-E01]MDF0728251.1 hypothetical protein [Cytobacillus sp. S13-E01]